MTAELLKNLQELQQTFEEAKAFAEQELDVIIIVKKLETYPLKFRSIAYEATAMVMALRDLEEGEALLNWNLFLKEYGQPHAIQVHVGLGWALAQQRLDALPFLADLEPLLRWRVLDGYGYYDGFFRRRKMLQGVLPDFLNTENAKSVYYQGIGRSLWYTSKGSIEGLLKLITQLPEGQQPNLWRGIGIASSYVGGIETFFWQQLGKPIVAFQPQLAAGAVMAINSRLSAGSVLKNEEFIHFEWCNMQVTDVINQVAKIINLKSLLPDAIYFEWIETLDCFFAKN